MQGTSGTSFTDTGVAPGTYVYTVRSVGADGDLSANSNEATATVEDVPDPDPTTVNASGSVSGGTLTVTMTADNCFTSYRLRALPQGAASAPLPIIKTGQPCQTTVVDTIDGLTSGETYDITVSVWTSAPGNSVGDSFEVTVGSGPDTTQTTIGPPTTPAPTTTPPTPTIPVPTTGPATTPAP